MDLQMHVLKRSLLRKKICLARIDADLHPFANPVDHVPRFHCNESTAAEIHLDDRLVSQSLRDRHRTRQFAVLLDNFDLSRTQSKLRFIPCPHPWDGKPCWPRIRQVPAMTVLPADR